MDDAPELRIAKDGRDGTIRVAGDLTRGNADGLEQGLAPLVVPGAVTRLDLSGLDIEDAAAAVILVNALRALRARSSRLVVHGAPQVLAHNLYRLNLLAGDTPIELVAMREDLPYA